MTEQVHPVIGRLMRWLNDGHCNKRNVRPRYIKGMYRCDLKYGHAGWHMQEVIGGVVKFGD